MKLKKQFLLIIAFFFFCSYLGFGQTFSGTTGSIDDNNCPTTNDFTTSVSGVGVLGTTNFFNEVVINITHTYTSDLEITLTAPGGAPSVLLSSDNGGGGNNFIDTHFRLDAIFSIAAGSAPFTGDFRPEGDLTLFDGINADGTWTLEICDDAGADTGTLDSWEITFGTEPVEPFECTNPINPSPSCNNFNVVVVLDESGSIDEATETQVEAASFALANALLDTGAKLAFVEFAETGDIPTYGGFSGWNEVDQAYIDGLNNQSTGLVVQYGENDNTTGPLTNWEDALNKVLELNVVQVADIVLFMTDGNPTADSSGGTGTTLGNALDESCEVKQMGSHIFMLGVGTGIEANNLAEISGPIVDDGPSNPTLTVLSADYGLISAGDITQCFLDIAQSGCNNNLTLEKSVYAGHNDGVGCNGEETITNPNDSKVTYCFTISNDGDQVINNLSFSDSDIEINENDLTPTFQTSIASGQSITYYYEMTFSGGQTFPFLNTAEITGETPAGDPLSDSSSAEVTESLCSLPSLTTDDISICSESKTSIDLSSLVTSNGTVSYHNSQSDADTNNNPITNINVSPFFDTTYYVRSEVAEDCYVTGVITINVTQIPEQPILECWQTATINVETCEWIVTGEQPLEPETACYETATFNGQLCQWEISGEQPEEPETACYETATFSLKLCQWVITGEQPLEPEIECYETATFNVQKCDWIITGDQPAEPETACYETATFNGQLCQWEISGEQPEEPETACYETATFSLKLCQWVITGEQPLEPEIECYEIATFNVQKCDWIITGDQPAEPETACYETATFNGQLCQWEILGEQPEEPETACYETATFSLKLCQWVITGEQPLEPEIECYETATFNVQKCDWIITGDQPVEPQTACYETATFNGQLCQWEISGEQPEEPETACYETATFNDQLCQWEVTGEQPLEPITVCYKIATFNNQTCHWEITGEQPLEPETACYESARFNNQLCEWVVSGEQPIEPETACYETATFNDQLCEWIVTGEQPLEPQIECYETATFNNQLCEWIVTGEQPLEPQIECYETATFNDQLCEWIVTGEQPLEPQIECYETVTFNNQLCEWIVTGEQPLEPQIECYETATFNDQSCVWIVTGEQPLEPQIECYETATFNNQLCEWIVTGEQPLEPQIECYETATFNDQSCVWEVTGEQPIEPEIACYETVTFNYQLCEWEVFGNQPLKPDTECYETAIFNNQICDWEVVGEKPLKPEIACYETTTFNYQLCEWEVFGYQPLKPETACYEIAIFNNQLCEWEVTGEQPVEPQLECYETTIFNDQLCQWDITGVEPIISAVVPLCNEDLETYSVVVYVNIGDVTSSFGNPQDNMNGTWTITDIPTSSDVTITTSLDENCFDSVVVESPECISCIVLDVSHTNVTCFGLEDAIITVDFVSESASILVNNEVYDPNILYGPGTYIVTATSEVNSNINCTSSEVVIITEPDLVDVQVSSTDATCYGANDGTITIESLSEGAFYTIRLNGIGPDLSDQDFFAPGTYVVEARLNEEEPLTRNSSIGKLSERSQNPCIDAKLVIIGELDSTCKYDHSARKSAFDFEMYPNPTKGNLTITLNKSTDTNVIVELYDLVGTKLINQLYNKVRDKKINIELSDLASQVYYLKVSTIDGTKIKKIVLDK